MLKVHFTNPEWETLRSAELAQVPRVGDTVAIRHEYSPMAAAYRVTSVFWWFSGGPDSLLVPLPAETCTVTLERYAAFHVNFDIPVPPEPTPEGPSLAEVAIAAMEKALASVLPANFLRGLRETVTRGDTDHVESVANELERLGLIELDDDEDYDACWQPTALGHRILELTASR